MPVNAKARNPIAARRKKIAPKPRRKAAAYLLFIQCQASLPQSRSLAIGTKWHARLSASYPDKQIAIAATDRQLDLLAS
jgi:hypothetical protein